MNAEDGSKADNVQKSETKPVGSANVVATLDEVTDNCWDVDISSEAPDPKDMTGCARRMRQLRQLLHTFFIDRVSASSCMTCSLLITSLTKILTFATYTTLDPRLPECCQRAEVSRHRFLYLHPQDERRRLPLLFTRFSMHRPSGIHMWLLVHWIEDATAECLNVSEQHLGK